MLQALVMVVTTVGLVVGVASPAWAHANLDQSEPAAGSVLTQPPDAVVLRFSEPVETQLGSVKVFDGARHVVPTSAPRHSDGNRTVRVSLPKLADGPYVVSWRVVSADSHPVGATFTFTVGPPGTRPAVASADTAAPSDRSVGVGFGALRFIAFASLALLVGGGIFVVGLHPAVAALRSVKRLLVGSWVAALAASLLGIAFQGAYASGGPLADILQPSLWREVAGTEFGRAWLARAVILCVAALPLRLVLGRRGALPPALLVTWGVVLMGLVVTVVAAGHALTGRWVLVGATADLLHVAAMAFWVGGLVVLVLVISGADAATLRDVVPRFSRLAFAAVTIIVASGVVQSWRQLGSLHALTSSTYGRLLLVKVALVGVMLALAGLSRRLVMSRLRVVPPGRTDSAVPVAVGAAVAVAEPGDLRRRLRKTVLGEVATALVVLAVTAGLVNAAPPPRVASGPFDAQLTMGSLQADVVIDPPRVGSSALHLYLATANGEPATVAEVTADLTQPPALPNPLPVRFTRITQNHFVANDLVFPFAGRWTILLKARVGEFDEQSAVLTVRIT
jgi:copper transport protein